MGNEEYIWVTRDGERMYMHEMSDTHLIKAYNYFSKLVSPQAQVRVEHLTIEIERRKQLAFFEELSNLK